MIHLFPPRDLKEAASAHHTDTCTAIFMATLFTMARMWNQPGIHNRWMDDYHLIWKKFCCSYIPILFINCSLSGVHPGVTCFGLLRTLPSDSHSFFFHQQCLALHPHLSTFCCRCFSWWHPFWLRVKSVWRSICVSHRKLSFPDLCSCTDGMFLCSLSSPTFQMLSPCLRFPPMIPSLWWLLPLFCRNFLTSWNLISQCSLLCSELLEWVPENPGLCLYLLEVSEFILHLDICSTLDRFWSRMRDKDLIPFFTQFLIYSVSFAKSFKFQFFYFFYF